MNSLLIMLSFLILISYPFLIVKAKEKGMIGLRDIEGGELFLVLCACTLTVCMVVVFIILTALSIS
jgi:hypothetical protein